MENIQIKKARFFYFMLRYNGNPVVYHTKLSKEVRVCSIKGTDFEITLEGVNNAWEAKTLCLQAWKDNQNE